MDAALTAITTVVSPAAIWAVIAGLAGFIGAMVIVSLGLHFLRKTVSGAAKGKAKF